MGNTASGGTGLAENLHDNIHTAKSVLSSVFSLAILFFLSSRRYAAVLSYRLRDKWHFLSKIPLTRPSSDLRGNVGALHAEASGLLLPCIAYSRAVTRQGQGAQNLPSWEAPRLLWSSRRDDSPARGWPEQWLGRRGRRNARSECVGMRGRGLGLPQISKAVPLRVSSEERAFIA